MLRNRILPGALVVTVALGLGACTNPYDPGQRAVGGGLLGAGAGAAIGAATGGSAATGALIGGALGAVTGAVTTPPPPAYGSSRPYTARCAWGTRWVPGYRDAWGRWVPGYCAGN
jgi:hypothetical protein